MDNLWTRRSNSSKLSLSTKPSTTTESTVLNENTRPHALGARRNGDSSSHSNKNPFHSMTSSTSAIASPTGASSAFALGTGAFASFGSAKTPKTPGTALDFGSVVGLSAKTPVTEKSKELGLKSARSSQPGSKTTTPPPSHSLKHSWAFWYRPPIVKSNGHVEYEKTLHAMAGFDNVEDFWLVYSHLKRPSTLPVVSDYHIFKKGIRPIWEDDDNKRGGKWIVRLKKGVADRYWQDLCLALIGDQFAEASEEVCGAVLSVRNGEDILSIWVANNGGRVVKIRDTMKRVLAFPPDTKMEFKTHDSSIAQRAAIDDARKDKVHQQHNHHPSSATRNGSKDELFFDKKQAS